MHKLLDINEDYGRDIQLHYSQAVLYDKGRNEFMLLNQTEERGEGKVRLYYMDAKKTENTRTYTMEEIRENVKAVSLDDGYVNLNGYALLCERTIDGKYKKTTAMNNTSVQVLGTAYAHVHNKRVKRKLDAYICMKALKSRYYTLQEGLDKLQGMFSVALSPSIALVKQPAEKPEDEKVHIVYYDVYVGEITDGVINFEDPEIQELVIDQIKELGYAA